MDVRGDEVCLGAGLLADERKAARPRDRGEDRRDRWVDRHVGDRVHPLWNRDPRRDEDVGDAVATSEGGRGDRRREDADVACERLTGVGNRPGGEIRLRDDRVVHAELVEAITGLDVRYETVSLP